MSRALHRALHPTLVATAGLAALALATWTCNVPAPAKTHADTSESNRSGNFANAAMDPAARAATAAAWDVIYGVLQEPRCANCHPPVGSGPLQGDAMLAHAQLVQRGPEGHGVFGMRCDACHQSTNLESPHLPPGVRDWHMPRPDMPLVFVGLDKRALCEQMRDPARNGGKTPEQLLEHMASDPLVLWGWNPGPGRAPVSVPHEQFVAAVRTWLDNDCGCPDR